MDCLSVATLNTKLHLNTSKIEMDIIPTLLRYVGWYYMILDNLWTSTATILNHTNHKINHT